MRIGLDLGGTKISGICMDTKDTVIEHLRVSTRREDYDGVIERLCKELIDDGGYDNIAAPAAAEALTCMSNGLWLSHLISPKSWDRQVAMDAIMSYLTNVFPKHFPTEKSS